MAGTTIRDVILKVAIEMAESRVKTPGWVSEFDKELEKLRAKGKSVGDDIAASMEKATRAAQNAAGGVGGAGGAAGGGTSAGRGFSGANRQLKTSEMEERRQIYRMERFLELSDKQEFLLKRNTRAITENAIAHGTAAKAAVRHNSALMQLIASHEGMLHIPNGSARMVGMLPTGPGLAIGAAAALGLGVPLDQNMRRNDALDMARRGVLPEGAEIDTSFTGWNTFAKSFQRTEDGAGRRIVRPEGIGGWIGRQASRFSAFTTGEFIGTNPNQEDFEVNLAQIRADQQKSRDQLARDTIRGRTMAEYQGAMMRDDGLQALGGMSSTQRLGKLRDQAAYGVGRLLQAPDGELDPRLGGAQRGADVADFRLQNMQQQLSVQQSIVRELDAERSKILENTRAAQQQLDVERERLSAQQEALGGADSRDIGKVKGIAAKLARGEGLTIEEAKTARQFGVAEEAATQAFQNRFQQQFSPEEQQALGLGKGVAQAQRGLADAMRNQADALPEIEAEIQAAVEETKKMMEELVGLFRQAFDMRAELAKVVEQIKRDMQNRQHENNRRNGGGG